MSLSADVGALWRWGVAFAALALAVGLGAALIGPDALGLRVPPANGGSSGDVGRILGSNLLVAAVILLAIALTHFGRSVGARSRGPLPSRAADAVVLTIAAVNAIVLGIVLGALGWSAAERVLPHAPFELGAYALLGHTYIRQRRRVVSLCEIAPPTAIAIALLAAGALIESYVSGSV